MSKEGDEEEFLGFLYSMCMCWCDKHLLRFMKIPGVRNSFNEDKPYGRGKGEVYLENVTKFKSGLQKFGKVTKGPS